MTPSPLDRPDAELRSRLDAAVAAALDAGGEIRDVYGSDFAVVEKADRSPLTAADTRAHRAIGERLAVLGLPILSEEGRSRPYAQRRRWDELWIVDPLDGTKEFVSRNGEFTVNIALVADGRPVLGVVYAPVADCLYAAAAGFGAWRVEKASRAADWRPDAVPLPRPRDPERPFTVVGSRSHANAALTRFVEALRRRRPSLTFTAAGSALKFCRVAEGDADIYPRPAPTMEWDTAAGQCLVEAAGGRVTIWETDRRLHYNREDLVNPGFVAWGRGVEREVAKIQSD